VPQMLKPRADCLVRPPARTRGPHERLEPTARCDDGDRILRMEPAGQRSVGTGRWHPARNGAIDTAVWRDAGRGRAADRQSLGRNAPDLLPRYRSGHPAQGARQPERAGALPSPVARGTPTMGCCASRLSWWKYCRPRTSRKPGRMSGAMSPSPACSKSWCCTRRTSAPICCAESKMALGRTTRCRPVAWGRLRDLRRQLT
jgi:hypothetical protein